MLVNLFTEILDNLRNECAMPFGGFTFGRMNGFNRGGLFGGGFNFGGISNPFANRTLFGIKPLISNSPLLRNSYSYNNNSFGSGAVFNSGFNMGNIGDQFGGGSWYNSPLNLSISTTPMLADTSMNLYNLGCGVNNYKITLPTTPTVIPSSSASSTSTQSSSYSQTPAAPAPSTGKYDTSYWKNNFGYNETIGNRVLDDAKRTSKKDPGQCAGYTRRTLEREFGLSLPSFSARTFESKIAPKLNGKYKKVAIPKGAKLGDLPPGTICLYFPDGGCKSHWKSDAAKRLGHVSTNGYSNGYLGLMPDEIWIPV